MAQKFKPFASPDSPADRIAKARREGRTQQALELARQLYKHDPTDEHLELLRQATLERGQQLQSNGYLKDAATVFGNAMDMGGTPEFRALIAAKLAACGAAPAALKLVEQLPEAERAKILAHAADSAVREGPAGKAKLPAELHPQFDIVVQAFAHAERGEDEATRTSLQGIGLQSPFLEWKVLLRGLLAWYVGDDARALENWQRLDPQRLPYRLAAPFRIGIDAAFGQAQPPAVQQALRQLADRFTGSGLVRPLQVIQDLLAKGETGPALRQAEGVLPALRKDHPALASRLAQCFFWAIVEKGEPEDAKRWLRVFGAPADDPQGRRLEALSLEKRGYFNLAQQFWRLVEQAIEKAPTVWPGELGKQARALIWEHIGRFPEGDELSSMFAPALGQKPMSAEECLRRSVELAPQRLGPHHALVEYFLEAGQLARAANAGKDLLRQFPDHVATLEILGDLAYEKGKPREALPYFEKALALNPLEKRLRLKASKAHERCGLELVADEDALFQSQGLDTVRGHFEAAWRLQDGLESSNLLARLATLELKAGQIERAAPWLDKLRNQPHFRVAAAYALLCEGSRARLHGCRDELMASFHDALQQAVTPLELLRALHVAALQHLDGPFDGQIVYQKKLLARARKPLMEKLAETELVQLCRMLDQLQAKGPAKTARALGRRKFRKNPYFLLFEIDALLGKKNFSRRDVRTARFHLNEARELAAQLPREQQHDLVDELEQRQARIEVLTPEPAFDVESFFANFGGFGGRR